MRLKHIVQHLEDLAPLAYAESWDNVGLLAGDPEASISRICLTIDATPAVLAEAKAAAVDLLVAYHPPLFKPVKRFVAHNVLFDAVQQKLAVYCPHTALDVVQGGTNDVLADAVGIGHRDPLRPTQPVEGLHKLVVFVPPEAHDRVADALFAAGAGNLGAYSRCSFVTEGYGSFVPQAGASPAKGEVGEPTRTAERRLELLLRPEDSPAVVAALRRSHPYEEPAFDITALWPVPQRTGQGRVGLVGDQAGLTVADLAQRLCARLRLDHVLTAVAPGRADHRARRIGVVAGAADSLVGCALQSNAEVLVTGEIRHHTMLTCMSKGLSVIALGHDSSERAALPPLQKRLEARLPGLIVQCSRADQSLWRMHRGDNVP